MDVNELLPNIGGLGGIVIIIAFVAGLFKFAFEYLNIKSNNTRRADYKQSFNTIVAQLSSDVPSSQLSAAILLRRFFGKELKKKSPELAIESVNVISALLRTLPTSVYQKTLGDDLAYAQNLSSADLQKTNLQDVYFGVKDGIIIMDKTDFFLADLSYALLENITGIETIFYRSVLFCAQIKNCNFSKANFTGADLTGICFKNVILKDATFTDAINIPESIVKKLENGIYVDSSPVTAKHKSKNKTIFFSMLGTMTKGDELITKDFKKHLEANGYDVIYYKKDDYPKFGQLNRVRQSINKSSAMIAFGLKQINVQNATYRPGTETEEEWNDKWLSTPWSEIEVGMGVMKGMPILLVKDPSIDNGIFDKHLSECFVATISTYEDSRKLFLNKSFVNWLSKI